jgi:hypothetical protein
VNEDALSWGKPEILMDSSPAGSLHYPASGPSAEVFKAAFLLQFSAIFHLCDAAIPHIIVQC